MQVVIICGGKGSRLKKNYKSTPKSLIKFEQKPNLKHQIDQLKKSYINDFLFLTNYQNKKITNFLKKINIKNYKILTDKYLFGTAGALINAKNYLKKEFIVLYSDIFIKFDFKNFIKFARKKKSNCVVVVQANSHPHDSDTVEYDKNYIINKIIFKNSKNKKINNATASIFYFKKKAIKNIVFKKNSFKDIVKNILPLIVKKKRLYAYKTIEYLNDFGTQDRLNDVKYSLNKGNIENLVSKNNKIAVFLGRDGVINKELDKGVKNIKEFIILPKIGKAIAKLNLNNIPCFIVSNQSVLAKKQITIKRFKEIIIYLDKHLSKHKAYIDDFLICANYKKIKYNDRKISFFSKYRKPNPGMIICLAKKYNINLRKSYLIGGNDTDILTGKLANLKTVLIKNIKTKSYRLGIKPDFNVNNLYEAVSLILRYKK
jgi:histidinol-phosphate phosphatase family protein|tara:strand:- start:8568 stop:9854 length:1287 start_codon:yes stop_codon:yes gene_type:complete